MQERKTEALWIQHTASSQNARRRRRRRTVTELIERLMQVLPNDGAIEPLEGLLLNRASTPTRLEHSVFFPAFCVIAQGQQGDSAGRQPLLVRARTLPYRHGRGTHCEPNHRGVAGAPVSERHPQARLAPGQLGDGRGRTWSTAEPVPHDSHRREPAGGGSAGCGAAAREAPGLPERCRLPGTDGHAGDRLPAPEGSAARQARTHRGPGEQYPAHHRGHRRGSETSSTSRCASRRLRASWG